MPERWMRIAAYVVCQDDQRRFLLAHLGEETGVGRWTLPGGGLDPGEHPEDGALRELTEETGYRGTLDALVGVDIRHFVDEDHDAYAIRIIYRGRVTGGELTAEIGGSTDFSAWCGTEEIADAVPLVGAALALVRRPGRQLAPRDGPLRPRGHGAHPVTSAVAPPILVVHAVLTGPDGRVLLVRRRDADRESWDLPGGPARHGESLAATLARLLTGPSGVQLHDIPLTAGTDVVDGVAAVRITCLASTDDTGPLEGPDLCWSAPDELAVDTLNPAARDALGMVPAADHR